MTARCKLRPSGVDFHPSCKQKLASSRTDIHADTDDKRFHSGGVFCLYMHFQMPSDMSAHDSVLRMCVCYSKDTSSHNSHFQNIWPDILPGNWCQTIHAPTHPYLSTGQWHFRTELNCLQRFCFNFVQKIKKIIRLNFHGKCGVIVGKKASVLVQVFFHESKLVLCESSFNWNFHLSNAI